MSCGHCWHLMSLCRFETQFSCHKAFQNYTQLPRGRNGKTFQRLGSLSWNSWSLAHAVHRCHQRCCNIVNSCCAFQATALRITQTVATCVLQIPGHAVDPSFVDEHFFLPAHPLCRALPSFAADKSKGTDVKTCNKFYKNHPGLTPGMFTLFCAHRKCLGFNLMADQEGPSTAFELIYTRFQSGQFRLYLLALSVDLISDTFYCAAPKMIVYDKACNLQRYVMRRAPHFFSSTLFRIDRLHIRNHDG